MFAEIKAYESLKEVFGPFSEGRWMEEVNLHLTLYFFGEVDDPEPIIEALQGIRIPQEALCAEGFGFFEGKRTVFYAKVPGPVPEALHREICRRIPGLQADDPFIPHITLGRFRSLRQPEFDTLAEAWGGKELGRVVPELVLLQSIRTPEGPRYQALASWS